MDFRTVLTEVEAWPVGDRIRLVNEVLDRLREQGHEPELSEETKSELDAGSRVLAWADIVPEEVPRLSLGFNDELESFSAGAHAAYVRRGNRLVWAAKTGIVRQRFAEWTFGGASFLDQDRHDITRDAHRSGQRFIGKSQGPRTQFPYAVYYLFRTDRIDILAVFHIKRRPRRLEIQRLTCGLRRI